MRHSTTRASMRDCLRAAGAALLTGVGCAQAQRAPAHETGRIVIVAPDAAVAVGADTFPVLEPHLAVNPRNSAHLLAGAAIVIRPDLVNADASAEPSAFHCVALASFDGGRHWTRHTFPVPNCLDPWVVVHPDGTALFAMISTVGSRLLVYRSADGGRTWDPRPTDFGRSHDHATMVLDSTGGARHGSVYVVSRQDLRRAGGGMRTHVFVARTADAGRTYDTTRVVPFSLAGNTMSSAVLSDGTLVVPLSTFGRPLGDVDWFLASSDGARTFSEPAVAPRGCARSFPHLAADGSRGPYRDHLYYVCNDSTYRRVLVLRSGDGGQRWSEPIAANGGSGAAPYARNAVATVDSRGVLGVSWYDARHDPDTSRGRGRCQALYFTASLDGGRTFLPEVRVSTGQNCPTASRNGQAGARWLAGGDYHGLVASPGGAFLLLWADSRSGVYQLRSASVRVDGVVISPRVPGPAR